MIDFETLYYERNDWLINYCRKYLPNADDAADAAQTVWLKLLNTKQKLRNPAAWLTRLATTTVADYYRYKARLKRGEPVSLDEYTEERLEYSAWLIEPGMDLVERAAWCEAFETGWQECSDEQRQVVMLLVQGYRPEQIGPAMGKSVGAGKALLHRARVHFRAAAEID